MSASFVTCLPLKRQRTRMQADGGLDKLAGPDHVVASKTETASYPVIVPGKFDALHVGHRELVRRASRTGDLVLVLTFPGMADVLGLEKRSPVCTMKQREQIFTQWSEETSTPVRNVEIPFTNIRELSPEQFVDQMVQSYGTKAFVCGTDWRFGYRASGDVSTLRSLCQERSMIAEVVGPYMLDDAPVSSSRVRQILATGNVRMAHQLLGRAHRIRGRLDPKTGLITDIENMCPTAGVYAAQVAPEQQNIPPISLTVRVVEDNTTCPPTANIQLIDSAPTTEMLPAPFEIEFVDQLLADEA